MINNQDNYCDKWQGGNWETKSGESRVTLDKVYMGGGAT